MLFLLFQCGIRFQTATSIRPGMRLGKGGTAAKIKNARAVAMGEKPLCHPKNGLKPLPFFSNMAGTLKHIETI